MTRRRISKIRRDSSFRRRQGAKLPRSVTLIVCEGETEQIYFQALRKHYRLSSMEVVIPDNTVGSAPQSVVQLAEAKYREFPWFDKIFCVFDRDTHESFQRARDRVLELRTRVRKPLPIHDAVSVPCFEVWVLLHFEQSDAPFNRCADIVRKISDSHIAHYKKAEESVGPVLMARIDAALRNADWLAVRETENNSNPSTTVHHVIRHLSAVGRIPEA